MKYLVTGAQGFLGSHLACNLASECHDVVAVDIGLHPSAPVQRDRLRRFPNIEFIEADLNDSAAVADLPDVDGIYHLAALNGTQKFYEQPWQVLKHSTIPTLNLLEEYARRGVDFFFYAGSSEAYAGTITQFGWDVPTDDSVALTIEDPKQLRWSYGGSKLHGEIACFAAAAELDIAVSVGRFHNAYGPYMGNHHVIPDFIERAKQGKYELFGSENTRSFIYIDDAISAVKVVAQRALGDVVNIGSPTEVSVLDMAKLLMEVAGWKGDITTHSAPPGSVLRRAPKITKLEALMDTSSFVPLREGLRRTLIAYGVDVQEP
jgi:nucleoside-diphosphate-sugar epimerase